MALDEPLLAQLIERVDGERGMRRKMRLLAGSWSLLRELSPEQRERLALAIGNRWAWRNVESYFGNPKQLSDGQRQVKAFFDSLRGADPGELRRAGREIREGRFNAASDLVLEAVEEALDEDDGVGDEEPPSPATVEYKPAIGKEPGAVTKVVYRKRAPRVTEPPPEEPSAPPPEAAPDEPLAPEPAAPAPEPATPAAEPVVEAAPEPATASEPRAEREPEPEAEEEEPQSAPVAQPEEPAPELDDAVEAFFALDTSEEATTSGLESLRILRRLATGRVSASRADRAEMIRSLASGWAARRAVSSLIRSRALDGLDEALALIDRLPSATHQAWCLGDLVEHWDLDDSSLRRVLAAAPTDAARRRLEGRAVRAV